MKRTWPYLGALLPFTTTMSLPATGLVVDASDDEPKAMRTRSERSDEEGKKQSSDQSDQEGNGASKTDAHAPTTGTQTDAEHDAYGDDSDGVNAASDDAGPTKIFHHANLDGGMYGSGGHGNPGGGHASASARGSSSDAGTSPDGSGGNSNEVTDPQNPGGGGDPLGDAGYVEPDPADADAMMILIGGTATGAGDGAMSSGQVDLEIVDHGWVTVGHGYAMYAASGDDGATADTFAAVEGADLVFMIDFGYELLNNSYSATYVLALDFEEDELAQMFGWNDWLMQGPFGQWLTDPETDVSIQGNFTFVSLNTYLRDDSVAVYGGTTTTLTDIGSSATAWIQSEQASLWLNGSASGIDTFISAAGSMVEIEDHFSSVSGVIVGVG
jgi:hypothetical protein